MNRVVRRASVRPWLAILLPAVGVAVADQASKLWALAALWNPPRAIHVVPGWLHFTPVENRGIAFGALQGHGTLLVLIVLGVLAVFAATSWRELIRAPLSTRVPAGLVAGGAVGNLIDRMRLGFVADFVTLPKLSFFQVFNIADSAITVGGVLLALLLLRRP